MLSRVAESIYWHNRYIERVENIARFVDVNLNLMIELPPDFGEQWQPLIQTSGEEATFKQLYATPSKENVIRFLTFDRSHNNSLLSCLILARENARGVRERISTELWEQVNQLYWMVKDAAPKSEWSTEELFLFFEKIKKECYVMSGIADNTLSYSEEWHFARVGKFLERVDQLSRILDVKFYYLLPKGKGQSIATTIDLIQWRAVLRSISAEEMYRREYGILNPMRIAEFLILDPLFPRSIRHGLTQLQDALLKITGNHSGSFSLPIEKTVGRLKTNLDYIEIDEIFNFGLHEYLVRIQTRLDEAGSHIYDSFFAI